MNVTATLFGQIATFLILIWFIKQFLWGPLTGLMEERKKQIADGLAAAERGKHEQELAQKRATDVLHQAREQAADIISKAEKRAGEIVEESKAQAKAEGDRLLTAARSEIDQEVNRAKEVLRKQVVELAVAGAGQVLKKEIDSKTHQGLLNDLVASL